MKHILKCQKCGAYTMKDSCPLCGAKTETPKPAKYSPEDKYASYRRQVKKQALSDKGLL
jgi:H/ACA ribonucleoprotein complex subunit 3